MKYLKKIFRPIQNESGQVVVFTVFALAFFGLMGALSIDVGIYLNDRRDAQNVVDKAALAGALELTLVAGNAAATAATVNASDKAYEWAANNGIDLSDPNITLTVNVVNTCYNETGDPYPTGVGVSLRREAGSVFLGFVPGVTDWNVGATALACAGRPNEATGFLPIALSRTSECFTGPENNRVPRLGEFCDILVEQGGGTTSLRGALGFDPTGGACLDGNPSGANLGTNIQNGVQVTCAIEDSVASSPGGTIGPIRSAFLSRMGAQGACETNPGVIASNFSAGNAALNAVATDLASPSRNDGSDDFFEIWQFDPDANHPAAGLVPYDCDPVSPGPQSSPRNVLLIIIDDYDASDGTAQNSYIVRGFARAYLEGCTRDGSFNKDCSNIQAGGGGGGGASFTVHARFVQQLDQTNVNLGLQNQYGDIQVFLWR